MKYGIISVALTLLFLQSWFVLQGAPLYTKYWNPLWILISAIVLGVVYLYICGSRRFTTYKQSSNLTLIASGMLATGILVFTGIKLSQAFQNMPDASQFSDVNPQLEALYARFITGEQPYYPVVLTQSNPFPVYMPLHWLPLGMAAIAGIDPRWTSYILFVIAVSIGFWLNRNSPWSAMVLMLPALVLLGYLNWNERDLADTYELIVAAYYLLLANALAKGKYWLITIGIICCLLSRYTLVFWCPMFAVLLWLNAPKGNSFIIWGSVVLAVLALYVFPFLVREPSILRDGVAYHNNAAIADWQGYGINNVSWTHEDGISFAAIFKEKLPGDNAQQVTYMRMIQASMMLLLMVGGIFFYGKVRRRISVPEYSLALLYFFVIFFYLFSPLTYKYYWISPLMIAAVMVGAIINKSRYVGKGSIEEQPNGQ